MKKITLQSAINLFYYTCQSILISIKAWFEFFFQGSRNNATVLSLNRIENWEMRKAFNPIRVTNR